MNKIKKAICLLCTAILLLAFTHITAYAQEGLVLTPELVGSSDSIYIVRITNRVVEIQDGAFANLHNLQEIKVDNDNPYYASFGGCLYNKDYTVLLCIPQNTTSVQVKTSITSRTPHALDGLSQDRIDALDKFLSDKNTAIVTEPIQTQANVSTSTTSTVQENTNTTTDFSQYVYTDDKGRKAFKYTGTGNSAIYVPEGVEIIVGFCSEPFDFNYEITYIHLPSTIKKCMMADFYNDEAGGYDTNLYEYLYQCPNLRTVEGGGKIDYMCSGDKVTRRGGIVVWSNSSLVPYDAQAYTNYNNRNK